MRYVLFFFFVLLSCTKGPTTPEGLLEMYIQDITTKKVNKEYFEKYTSGKLWDSVAELSEEEFTKFVNLKKINNPSVEITNKSCAKDDCTLTYIVKYALIGENNKEFTSEVKKIATLKQFDGNWKILEVTNIKTFVDSKTPIEVFK